MYIAALLKFNVLKRKNQALENALTERQQENVAILLEHQNEKQQALQQRELEWLAGKIKIITEEVLFVFFVFVCSAFFNMGKKRNDIVSFLSQVFPLYFPAGESVLAKKMPGVEKIKKMREKENKFK